MPLLEVTDLKTYFHTRVGVIRAVDGVSFSLEKGETLGIVGESGSGKSVTCYSILGLVPQPPGRIESGTARFAELDLLNCSNEQLRKIRGKRISMVFQDPMTSLNPYLKVSEQIIEPLLVHDQMTHRAALKKGIESLEEVGIKDASRRIHFYPHQFSGGMRQRVMIAMALISRPEILIADEPTTALDVTVQAQILELLRERQKELGLAVIYITHDLAVVAAVCKYVQVMYAGRIVEFAGTDEIFGRPMHPYTASLQHSIPALHQKGRPLYTIPGLPPDLADEITGCPFAARCSYATDPCHSTSSQLIESAPGHKTSCLRFQKGELGDLRLHFAADSAAV